LWANGNKPPQISTIDASNKSENKFLEWHLEGAFQSLDSFCLKPSWLLHRRLSRTFCVPACQPVAKMTVAVKRIPMMNDFMSMEFIQGKTYES